MKCLLSLFLLFSSVTMPLAQADEIFYTEDDDELFNRGRFVGEENGDYLRVLRTERNKNWAIALGSTALGIAALILASD